MDYSKIPFTNELQKICGFIKMCYESSEDLEKNGENETIWHSSFTGLLPLVMSQCDEKSMSSEGMEMSV